MRIPMRMTVISAVITVLCCAMLLTGLPSSTPTVKASSHREAPLIIRDPLADNTDVYFFVSPDRPEMATVIANFVPFQEPNGGPNFYPFDDNVLYQVRFDNDGDAVLDIALEFRFRTQVINPETFLYTTNRVDPNTLAGLNVRQTYSVTAVVVSSPRNVSPRTFNRFLLADNLPTPPNNVGPRSTPNYETNYAERAIRNVPFAGTSGINFFAGQRDEGFYVDLGSAFDLFGLRPLNPAHIIPLPTESGRDGLAGFNVNTIALQFPIQLLTNNGTRPTDTASPAAIVGVYATASRPRTTVLGTNDTMSGGADNRGTSSSNFNDCNGGAPSATCVQVSRLANPLVNELFIPIGATFFTNTPENDKDRYNATLPAQDTERINFIRGDTRDIEPVALINALYPPVFDAPTRGRNDLVRVYLTGVPGATRPAVQNDPNDPSAGPGAVPAELMRLNLAVPPVAPGGAGYSRLGVIAGDLSGYPNGRRVGDDVTDITLRVAAGVLLTGTACAGGTASCNQAPNNALTDGVDGNDRPYRTTFPYLASPFSGYDSPHSRTPTP